MPGDTIWLAITEREVPNHALQRAKREVIRMEPDRAGRVAKKMEKDLMRAAAALYGALRLWCLLAASPLTAWPQ